MSDSGKIMYTWTDEAPALATLSFLPVVRAFTASADVEVDLADISLAGRVLAVFADRLPADQQVDDALSALGDLAKKPEANIIKLPNISASVPQLLATIEELQTKGFDLPNYPESPETDDEIEIRRRYDKVKGSAVNPVLREGNSDRRAPAAVKNYAKKNPHSMGAWSPESKTHVATMSDGDFRSNEQSTTIEANSSLTVTLTTTDGQTQELKTGIPVLAGEVVDATYLSKKHLLTFLAEQVADAKAQGVLFSLHMKATMMKVSDPLIFGHAVDVFFADVFDKHADTFDSLGINTTNGFGDVVNALEEVDDQKRSEIEADIAAVLENQPDLAMVNSDKGITNLHVPSDVIIDASMPAMIRSSGQMWNSNGELQDTKAVIPDSSYAALYDEAVMFHIKNGAFDPRTMGTSPNVGLMAQKAEEYGSHDKTFEIPADGTVTVTDTSGSVLFTHDVSEGDIWRSCQVKDEPIRDWVKLAVRRARATGWPAVFWLDEARAHDAQLITKVNEYLQAEETEGLDIRILPVGEATRLTLERMKDGENTISVTGNVLRDYNTDLFPILELGTSAKMLSIVPLMNGGGLFETGAGGSAPKHVQQFENENHLRWDSLGEFLALAVSLDHLASATGNARAKVLGDALDQATELLLTNGKSPSRKVNELDTRGSHFYVALYWAQALAEQTSDTELAATFAPLAKTLADQEDQIVAELIDIQGAPADIGGYYMMDVATATAALRPSETFNAALDEL